MTHASVIAVIPKPWRYACAARIASSQRAGVKGGTSRRTRFAAPSWSVPCGDPSASRSIRPSAGSGVAAVTPASSRARELTQAPWPSRFSRKTGRPGTAASRSPRDGVPPGKAGIPQPLPMIHGSSGWAAA